MPIDTLESCMDEPQRAWIYVKAETMAPKIGASLLQARSSALGAVARGVVRETPNDRKWTESIDKDATQASR